MTAIHQFLLVVAAPNMLCPVNPIKSLYEIIRVAKEEVAIMAIRDGRLVGTLGLMRPVWWYGDAAFLTDRWHFILPEERHGDVEKLLMAEARGIAAQSGLKFIDQGKIRRKKDGDYILFPRLYEPNSDIANQMGSA